MDLSHAAIVFFNASVFVNMLIYELDQTRQADKKEQKEQIKISKSWRRTSQAAALLFLNATLLNSAPFVLHQNQALLLSGVLVSMLGVALLVKAKATLAECYSPCSRQKIPPRVISSGPYGFIRHPIYTSNLLTVGGFVLAFGSAPALLLFLYLLRVYIKSAALEERVLAENHPEYSSLMTRTGRFLPRLWTILPGFRFRKLQDSKEITQFKEEFLNAGGFLKFADSSPGQFTFYGYETRSGLKAGVAVHNLPYRSIHFLNHHQKEEVLRNIPAGTYEVTGLWKKKGAGFFPPVALMIFATIQLIKDRHVTGAIVSATKECYAKRYAIYGFRSVYETLSPRDQGRMSIFLIEKKDGWKALFRITLQYISMSLRARIRKTSKVDSARPVELDVVEASPSNVLALGKELRHSTSDFHLLGVTRENRIADDNGISIS